MKRNIVLLSTALLALSFISCSAQLVKSVKDISLIDSNQNKFLGHPLSVLLADIKPEIKLFFTDTRDGSISFYFVDRQKWGELSQKHIKTTRLRVFVTGSMAGNNEDLPVDKRFSWTPEYKQKNQDLIVNRIVVIRGDE